MKGKWIVFGIILIIIIAMIFTWIWLNEVVGDLEQLSLSAKK